MSVTEEELQQSAVAPRVTLEEVNNSIAAEHYFTAYEGVLGERFNHQEGEGPEEEGSIPKSLGLLTFCVLTLQNGYTVYGTSACADFSNYNKDIGQRLAKQNAVNQIWPLLGYQLKNRLHAHKNPGSMLGEPTSETE